MGEHTVNIVITQSGADQAASKIKSVGDAAGTAHGSVSKLEQGMHVLSHALAAVAAAVSVHEIVQMADEYTALNHRLGQVTSSASEQTATWQRLMATATQHSVSIEGVVLAYTGLSRATQQYGISSDQVHAAVSSMMAVLNANGRSADEVSGAMRRLGASMTTGQVSGRAFTTLLMQFPELMEAISRESGYSVRQLQALGENGSISMRQLIDWIGRASAQIRDHGQHTEEVSKAWVRFKNVLTDASGTMSQLSGSSNGLSGILDYMGQMAKAVVIIVAVRIDHFKRFGEMIGGLLEKLPGMSGFFQRLSAEGQRWAQGWRNLVQGVAADTVTSMEQQRHVLDDVTHSVTTAQAPVRQLTQSHQQLGQSAQQATGPLRSVVTSVQQTGQAATTAARSVTVFEGGVRRTIQVTSEAARGMDTLTASDRAAGQSMTDVNQGASVASTGLSQIGAQAENANARITVLRGGLQGMNQTVYENGRSLTDMTATLTRTSNTVDALGNSTRVTTQSLRDANGAVTATKRTVETFADGIRTLREYIIGTDGAIRMVSETVTEATQRIEGNSSALSRNAMALAAVTSSAGSAAAAYQGLASAASSAASGISNVSSASGQIGQSEAGNPMSGFGGLKGSFTAASGFHFEGGGTPGFGQVRFDQVADPATSAAFTEFNTKVQYLKAQVMQATGISQWNWPSKSAYNPYGEIPAEQRPDPLRPGGSQPVGSIPALQDILEKLKFYGLLPNSTASSATGAVAASITAPGGSTLGGQMTFAQGGSFTVPGSGGTDSQYVNFMATPGEKVHVSRPDSEGGVSGNKSAPINVFMTVHAKDAASFGRNRNQINGALADGVNRANSMIQRRR